MERSHACLGNKKAGACCNHPSEMMEARMCKGAGKCIHTVLHRRDERKQWNESHPVQGLEEEGSEGEDSLGQVDESKGSECSTECGILDAIIISIHPTARM